MQVLENAVRKLKMPSHVEEVSTRIEPRFETNTELDVGAEASVSDRSTASAKPIPLNAMRSDTPPNPRKPIFSELPEPVFEDANPDRADKGGSGGGGAGAAHGQQERRFGPWLTFVGAVASIALLFGISYWTYKLGERDARDVPIVAALEGPARVAPADRGGLEVAHQGHSVNNVLEGQGVEAVASSVKIAPPDNDLVAEDAPTAELNVLVASRAPEARPVTTERSESSESGVEVAAAAEIVAPSAQNSGGVTAEGTSGTTVVARAEPDTTATSVSVEPNSAVVSASDAASQGQATVSDNAANAQKPPLTEVTEVAEPQEAINGSDQIQRPGSEAVANRPEVEAIEAPLNVVESGETSAAEPTIRPAELKVAALGPLPPSGEGSQFAPATMKLPQKRPANVNSAMANAVNAALATVLSESTEAPDVVKPEPAEQQVAAVNNLDVIPLPAGTRMIQLGAYVSEAIARQQWDRLSAQHDDLLGSKAHYVQRTNNSGKVFFRLRVAGYESRQATRDACAALSARGLPCITVTLR